MDILLFEYINGFAFKCLWLDEAGIFLAEYLPYVLVAVLFVFLIKNLKKYFSWVAMSFLSAGLAYAIARIIRLFWLRPRPFVVGPVNLLLDHIHSGAWPSMHASFFFALSTIVFFYNKTLGSIFLIASVLIGLSRIFVGVHWPADILAGAGIGILCAILIKKLQRGRASL
jgi:undecaprenyl-diphosphatase